MARGFAKKHPAAWTLALQVLAMAALATFVATAGLYLSGTALAVAYFAGMWPGQVLLHAATSYRCVQRGVPAIVAWPLGSMAFAGLYWAIVGLPPLGMAALLSAVCALTAAAASEVALRRREKA